MSITLTDLERRVTLEALDSHRKAIHDFDDASRLAITRVQAKLRTADEPLPQWCPVCKTYHTEPGEKTDAGRLVRQCPSIPLTDPRNRFENYP